MRQLTLPFISILVLAATLSLIASAPSSQQGSGPASKATCMPHLYKDAEEGYWRIDCSTDTTCCVYESEVDESGEGYVIWCDCRADGQPPFCCHLRLRIFPDDPGRTSSGEGEGNCAERMCGRVFGPCMVRNGFRAKCESIGGR